MRVRLLNETNKQENYDGDLELCFTGPLILHGNPSHVKEVANKSYVDSRFLSLDASNLVTGVLPVERLSAYTGDVTNVNGSNSFILNQSGVSPGIYTKLTVDSKGRVLAGENLTITDIPSLSWNKITKNRPTTLAGYGITDGIKKTGDIVNIGLTVDGMGSDNLSAATKEYLEAVIGESTGSIPVGNIVTKITTVTPGGFLRANGGEVSKTTYADLYAIIGDSFSQGLNLLFVGNGKPWKQQYDINTEQSGDMTNWTIGSILPAQLAGSQAIVTKDRVFLLGGRNGGIHTSIVYTAPISENGDIGNWTNEIPLPGPLTNSQAIVTKNRVYLLGGKTKVGETDNVSVSTVYTAPINEDGTLGTWTTDTDLPVPLSHSQAVVVKNRVYLLGGYNNDSISTVYTAPINEDGTLGTWSTDTNLPVPLSHSQAIVTKNRIYLLGGLSDGNNISDTYTALINEDSTLGSWSSDVSLPDKIVYSQAIVTKNRVYLIGGQWADNYYRQYSAPINEDGTLGTWTTSSNMPAFLSDSQAIITKNKIHLLAGYTGSSWTKFVYTSTILGGLNDYSPYYNGIVTNIQPTLVSRQLLTGGRPWVQQYDINTEQSGDISGWTTGTSLPGLLSNSQVIVTKNRVYLLGGHDNINYTSVVYTAPVNSDGTLGTWTVGTSLPGPLSDSQAIVTKNRVYLLGGYNNGSVSTVYTAPINEDGTLGVWTEGTSLPEPLSGSQAVVTKNRVYLLGGHNTASGVSSVYTAPINEDGTLGTWISSVSLPEAIGSSQAVLTKNRIYLLGGSNGYNKLSTVYTANIKEDGTLGAWTKAANLPESLKNSQVIVTKDKVYLLGGFDDNAFSFKTYNTTINEDGILGNWTTGTVLPGKLSESQAIVTKNRVYLLGGYNNDGGTSLVYTSTILGGVNDYSSYYDGTVTYVETIAQTDAIIGGGKPWRQQYDINTEQSGDITGWTINNALPESFGFAQAIVTKNRVYLLGGYNYNTTGTLSTVYTATINPDGALGTWTTSTPLPIGLCIFQAIVTKNRVYVLGGFDPDDITSVTYTAPINEDGTLGTWSAGINLPTTLSYTQAIVTKNRVYLLGGYDGNNQSSKVYCASINEDGTLRSWGTWGSLPVTLDSSQAIITKNRVYLLGGWNGDDDVSTVYTAPINEDGTLGIWTTAGNLPAPLPNSQAIVTKNRVYLLGGYNSTNDELLNIVYTAPINPDGTLGTWVTGTSLPISINGTQAIVTKGKVYLLGGYGSPGYISNIYTANFQGGLNDYAPYYNGAITRLGSNSDTFYLPDYSALETTWEHYYIKY